MIAALCGLRVINEGFGVIFSPQRGDTCLTQSSRRSTSMRCTTGSEPQPNFFCGAGAALTDSSLFHPLDDGMLVVIGTQLN